SPPSPTSQPLLSPWRATSWRPRTPSRSNRGGTTIFPSTARARLPFAPTRIPASGLTNSAANHPGETLPGSGCQLLPPSTVENAPLGSAPVPSPTATPSSLEKNLIQRIRESTAWRGAGLSPDLEAMASCGLSDGLVDEGGATSGVHVRPPSDVARTTPYGRRV